MNNNHQSHNVKDSVHSIAYAIEQHLKSHTGPFVIAIDGGSGAGKSVVASEVANLLGATVIQCDDFFNIKISDEDWDTFSVENKCRLCIDFERIRNEALLPLLTGKQAVYLPYYYLSMTESSSKKVVKEPSQIIILDGIYSSHWLNDLVDLKVLVNVPSEIRYKRHNLREGTDDIDWHLRWDPVEDYYFSVLRPLNTFDLVVVNE
ncbi:hypothetical protein R6U77_14120 [Lysinibacillus louembei]|uniref:Phosphoribulokinase/uridine kinase domain-containing protein n=1 Tax=Lysinibacillus louembei TaxID=1470088 RepID=A0ABZ0RVG6_9BACI|nr:hypothetical protein [Lysinibacillus louembei]WPK11016.1 hypothetical protein R6U77_14120 [Lysinibacillus louembei]